MVMIYLPTENLYYNARIYFRNNIMDTLPNDDREWKKAFSEWLGEQGCQIALPEKMDRLLAEDVLGVAPGYYRLCFVREEDAVMFVLRWA
jgi:hypothetical protein